MPAYEEWHGDIFVCSHEEGETAWDDFVTPESGSVFFHRYGWKTVVEASYGHPGYYLAAYKDDHIVGVLPLFLFNGKLGNRSLVSVLQADYAGLCASDAQARSALMDSALAVAKDLKAEHVELRHLGQGLEDLPSNDSRVSPVLNLRGSEEELWKSFPAKVRNQVRKAEKSSVTADIVAREELPEFHMIFSGNMRRLGSPTHSVRFFSTILSVFPKDAVLLLVNKDGMTIGGGIGLVHGTTFEVPWASCLAEYFRFCPNNALYWKAMQYAISRGCARLNFGSSPVDSGTYKFKMQWGAETCPLRYQYLENTRLPTMTDRRDRPSYRAFNAVWKRLPIGITNRIGPIIMRNLPL